MARRPCGGAKLLRQHRLQYGPDVIQHDALGRGDGVDAVGLEQVALIGEARQQERHPGDMMFVRESLIDSLEISGIAGAIVGWQAHAEQHDLGGTLQGRGDDMIEVVVYLRDRQPAQTVVPAQLHDQDIRMMTVQQRHDAAASSGGGFTTDAGIDDPAGGAVPLQAFFEQCHPSLFLIYTISGT